MKGNENCGVKINKTEIDQVEYTFLGFILNSQLKFDQDLKRLCKIVKSNLNCFRLIRQYRPLEAHQFMHAMIFSHLSYWGKTGATVSRQHPLDHYKKTGTESDRSITCMVASLLNYHKIKCVLKVL